MILIKADVRLRTVFERLIKTIGEPVEWNGVFAVAAGNLMLPGRSRSLFFQLDQKKIFSQIVEFPADFENAEESKGNEVLANALNMILYAFGRWGIIPGLRVDKDYGQLNKLFHDVLEEIHVETHYSGENMKFYFDKEQISYEDVIRSALDWAKAEIGAANEDGGEDEALLGLWHSVCWTKEQRAVGKTTGGGELSINNRLGHNFYGVDYQCPYCGAQMYMVVFPVDHEILVETEEGRVFLARAYTCDDCMRFFTPRPGKLIREGDIYTLSFGDDRMAYDDYVNLFGEAGDRCSNYKLNEFEADRNKKPDAEPADLGQASEKAEELTKQELRLLILRADGGGYPPEEIEKFYGILEQEWQKRQEEKYKSKNPGKKAQEPVLKDAAITIKGKEKEVKEKSAKKDNSPVVDREKSSDVSASAECPEDVNTVIKINLSDNSVEKTPEKINVKNQKEDPQEKKAAAGDTGGAAGKRPGEGKAPGILEDTDILSKAKSCQGKSYAQIKEILDEIRCAEAAEDIKSQILFRVTQYKTRQALKEAEQLIGSLPAKLGKKEYEACCEKLKKYDMEDVAPSRKLLDEKRSTTEKQEINDVIKRARKTNRNELLQLHESLKQMGYSEENAAPYLEKIYLKIAEMDQAEIERICPDMLHITFDQGVEAMKKISAGLFLPDLKQKTVDMLDKRLTKMKTDENIQLVRKLKKELESSVKDTKRLHYYDARSILGGKEDGEDGFCGKAADAIADHLGKYEYPVVIGDSSYFMNGKEGFIITPDRVICRTLFQSGSYRIGEIEDLSGVGIFQKGIQINFRDGSKKKLPGIVKNESRDALLKVLGGFLVYLQEKPESRKISYLAKNKHDVICCYRCGFTYKGKSVCPKCGYKENQQ